MEQDDLRKRLELIEELILEGRSAVSFYGWEFVLWGVGYAVAHAWQLSTPTFYYPWPLIMTLCAIVSGIGMRVMRPKRQTSSGHAIGAVWIAAALTLGLVATLGNVSHAMPTRICFAVLFSILGMAHAASGLVLRWNVQKAVALLWWVSAAALFFVSAQTAHVIFFLTVAIGQILFGIYLMVLEKRRKLHGQPA